MSVEDIDPREPELSLIRFQEPLSTIGEGKGVIATIGPRPGEDRAEEGDKEPPVFPEACSADLRLGVSMGMLDVEGVSSRLESGIVIGAVALSFRDDGPALS